MTDDNWSVLGFTSYTNSKWQLSCATNCLYRWILHKWLWFRNMLYTNMVQKMSITFTYCRCIPILDEPGWHGLVEWFQTQPSFLHPTRDPKHKFGSGNNPFRSCFSSRSVLSGLVVYIYTYIHSSFHPKQQGGFPKK